MATAESGIDISEVNSPVEIWTEYDGLTESKYWQEYISRLTVGRDMHTYITAASETGVGKTTLAFALCLLGDMSGWSAEQGTLDPAEYAHLYDKKTDDGDYYLDPGSWLLGDEWEQAVDSRRSQSKENLEASHAVATKRYRQIFGVYTLPSKSWMDNRFSNDAADFWIQAQETDKGKPKGEAYVYRLKTNEHYETSYTRKVETISWPVLDWHPEFKKLQQKKRDRMEGQIHRSYVHMDEVEEMKKNFWNKASKKTRYHLVKAMSEWGISQTDIAEILTIADNVEGLSQPRVSHFVNSDNFEEVYET
jgi:DNA polymerase III delta prime subunit